MIIISISHHAFTHLWVKRKHATVFNHGAGGVCWSYHPALAWCNLVSTRPKWHNKYRGKHGFWHHLLHEMFWNPEVIFQKIVTKMKTNFLISLKGSRMLKDIYIWGHIQRIIKYSVKLQKRREGSNLPQREKRLVRKYKIILLKFQLVSVKIHEDNYPITKNKMLLFLWFSENKKLILGNRKA